MQGVRNKGARAAAPRLVMVLAYEGVQSLDVTGPLEVFAGAQRLLEATGARDRGYRTQLVAGDGSPVRCSSGLTLVPDASLQRAGGEIDTLIVAGGEGSRAACEDESLIAFIRLAAGRARRTASVCTGAFPLARAGVLAGRRATTHWASAEELARAYPEVNVDADPIYVRDGSVWTSAGVTAGIDLALALVEEDLDRDAALTIARHLVMFLRRPGSQSQFSATLAGQARGRSALREVQRKVVEDIAGLHTVEAMAERAHMSARHFARAFRDETGMTPARYVERVRLEAARRALEEGAQPIAEIARGCGFGTPETMRRTFLRALAVAPAEYRRRFHVSADRRRAAA
jgi:transcriptional regulator GlxA family with amidase domain